MGMVLVNVHPDYMNFNNSCHLEEYRSSLYEDMLLYIKNKYNGMYWHALPREIANLFSRKQRISALG